MEEQEWVDKLQEEDVEEFSFYPHAFTRMKKGLEIELPDIDLDDSKDDEDSKKDTSSNKSTIKNISITIGGITLGAALGAGGAMAFAPEPTTCPAPITQTSSLPASTSGTKTPSQTSSTGASAPASSLPSSAPGAR